MSDCGDKITLLQQSAPVNRAAAISEGASSCFRTGPGSLPVAATAIGGGGAPVAKAGELGEPVGRVVNRGRAEHDPSRPLPGEPVVAVRLRPARAGRRRVLRHRHHERPVGALTPILPGRVRSRRSAWRSRISAERCWARKSSFSSPIIRTRSTSAWRSRANGTKSAASTAIFDITNSGVALALQGLAKSHNRLVIFDSRFVFRSDRQILLALHHAVERRQLVERRLADAPA